jgi:hypothetical protein
MNAHTEVAELKLGMMQSAEDDEMTISFPVSEQLSLKIAEQYERLQGIDMTLEAVERYRAARAAGVLAAIAKGIRSRSFAEGVLFIPKTELIISQGRLRITSLKAALPVPEGMEVKNVSFHIRGGEVTGTVVTSRVQS